MISFKQLIDAGLGEAGIRRRVATGRFHRVYRGVYAVGHAGLSERGVWKAATLACGPGSVLSHRSAAELWGMLPAAPGPSHVSVPGRTGREPRPGIAVHRPRQLGPKGRTIRDAIPVTRPRRTLEDLQKTAKPGELRNALRQAEHLGLPLGDLRILPDRAASELEVIFLQLLRRHRLPAPEVNARVGRFKVDFVWRAQRVIVETDGRRFHRGTVATGDDLVRDSALVALGYTVLRFGYWEALNEPEAVAAAVRAALGKAPAMSKRSG